MQTQIFIVESASEVRQVSTQQGTMTVQSIKLREVTGNNNFTQRWLVENISGTDLKDSIDQPVACCIENYVNATKDGREYNNLRVREIVKLNTIF